MVDARYIVNVQGVVERDGRYLVVERAGAEDHAAGTLGFPGGTVDSKPADGAVLESTVARELREEVGIEVDGVTYAHSSVFETDAGEPCLNVVMWCTHESGVAHPRSEDEVAAVEWLSAREIRTREDILPFTRRYLDAVERVRDDAAE